MCGICGAFGDADRSLSMPLIDEMNASQRHRGPDATYAWHDGRVSLGQTRLAVVDLGEGGRQPFHGSSGRVAVVFNGEIYNHLELRTRYALDVEQRCDGAVLPALWSRLGTAAFAELRGMFAIGVVDLDAGTVTAARDPYGIKPLYWARRPGGSIAFASEVRSLLGLLDRPTLTRDAVQHFLRYGSMDRDSSPFAGIHAVPANTWVQWDLDGHLLGRGEIRPSHLDAATTAGLRDSFLESVSVHLRSDVPTALLLSSGIDSAALAWACRQLGADLTCVTVDTGDAVSEASDAAAIAAAFGHHHRVLREEPDAELMERFVGAMQKPSIDGLNTFLVSKAIRELGIKVALTGVGGDEALAGYASFRRLRVLPALRHAERLGVSGLLARVGTAAKIGPKLTHLVGPAGPRDAAGLSRLSRRILLDDQVQSLAPWTEPDGPHGPLDDASARALSLAELRGYLGGTLLADADAFSMAWSVELRLPYVDAPFITQALAASPRRGVGKRGFAALLGNPLLAEITRRPKKGFSLPMDRWMRAGRLGAVDRVLEADAPVRRILDPAGIERTLRSWQAGQNRWTDAWQVTVLDAWLRSLPAEVSLAD
jgi:asparagine synthase (glutamine-hydrolysing)